MSAELLEAFAECHEGGCSCPTDEYLKVATMEVRPTEDRIAIRLEAKPAPSRAARLSRRRSGPVHPSVEAALRDRAWSASSAGVAGSSRQGVAWVWPLAPACGMPSVGPATARDEAPIIRRRRQAR